MMKKSILLILLLIISSITCGCTSNLSSAEKMDDIVLSLLKNKNYIASGLNNNEIILIDEFIKKEKYSNKIVNLNSLSKYSDLSYTKHDNSNGVYEEDGIFYIKYSDILFEKIVDSEITNNSNDINYYATTIYFNNRELNITKDIIPILFEDTKDNIKYTYTYRGTSTYSDAIVSYYNSVYDDTGMQIVFSLKNKKISSINIVYDVSNNIYNIKNIDSINLFGVNVVIIGILLILTFGILLISKKVALTKEI